MTDIDLECTLARIAPRSTGYGAERRRIPVTSPVDGRTLASVPEATPQDVEDAAARARSAQADWAQRSFRHRARPLLRFHDLLLDRQDELLDLIQMETGKARKDAYEELADTAHVARYYAYNARRHLRDERRRGALPLLTRTTVVHHPIGLVGIIAPWNYPLDMAVTDAIPALMAGNAVLLKPDHQTPLTALWIVDLLYQAGLPDGLFQVVNGPGPAVGGAVIQQADYLAFTGSTATGRIVARQAAERLIGCSLELGGKNPVVVLEDADLDHAAWGAARAAYSMAGQLCVSCERVFVQESVAAEFTERMVDRVRRMRLGVSLDWNVDMGSLISEDQLQRVQAHLHEALDLGARLLTGGRHRPDIGPFVLEPTLLADVPEDARVFHEETFGPVAALYTFHDDEELVRRINATRYGLSASIYSRDSARARRIGRRIHAGTISINDPYSAAWASVDAPMGGVKESGVGRRHGKEGIIRFTEPQTLALQRGFDLGPTDRIPNRRFATLFTAGLRILRRIPGLR